MFSSMTSIMVHPSSTEFSSARLIERNVQKRDFEIVERYDGMNRKDSSNRGTDQNAARHGGSGAQDVDTHCLIVPPMRFGDCAGA
jgi:hypothetical protein